MRYRAKIAVAAAALGAGVEVENPFPGQVRHLSHAEAVVLLHLLHGRRFLLGLVVEFLELLELSLELQVQLLVEAVPARGDGVGYDVRIDLQDPGAVVLLELQIHHCVGLDILSVTIVFITRIIHHVAVVIRIHSVVRRGVYIRLVLRRHLRQVHIVSCGSNRSRQRQGLFNGYVDIGHHKIGLTRFGKIHHPPDNRFHLVGSGLDLRADTLDGGDSIIIDTNFTAVNGSTLLLEANNGIRIEKGFTAQIGSNFHARVTGSPKINFFADKLVYHQHNSDIKT